MKFPNWLKEQTALMLEDRPYVIAAAICAIAIIVILIVKAVQ